MKKPNQKPKGFIAIVSLLIIGSIAFLFAMNMLLDGVSNASLSVDSLNYENARINIQTCLEDSLMRIKREQQFSQSLSYTISTNNRCSTSMNWYTPQQIGQGLTETLVDLDVTGTSFGFSRTFRYELKVSRFDVNYSDGELDYLNNIHIISMTELTS